MPSVASASHEHHERLLAMLDGLPALAAMLDEQPRPARLAERFRTIEAVLTGTLLPHVEWVERVLYPRLDELMGERHSMAQMRAEHADIRGLVGRLTTFGEALAEDALGPAGMVGLRRVLYRLYALLKVHLAEEEEYIRVLERNLTEVEQAELARGLEQARAEPL